MEPSQCRPREPLANRASGKGPRSESVIARGRRHQIIEAAVAIITEQGIQNLSLSEIESRAGMSRGQLTYYFPTKEDILLAVFDRLVQLTHERIGVPSGPSGEPPGGWELVEHLLTKLLTEPPVSPEFGCLQYTFLSQISHREDFRKRLATLYEQWRSGMALGLTADLKRRPAVRTAAPRALATLVQALLHGLLLQRAADPQAFDGQEMLELCRDVLCTYLWEQPRQRRKSATRNQSAPIRHRLAGPVATKGKNGERIHDQPR
jgi:AcrR family transcriptional regulator